MQKFAIKIILFLFPTFLLAILLELMLRDIPNDYSFKRKFLDKNSSKIEVLILGSSHAYFGINPQFFQLKSFNAAYISQSIDYDLEIFKKYKHNFKNLNYIIIPVDYFTLYSQLEGGIEKWRIKNYNIYYDLNKFNYSYSDNFELSNGKISTNLDRLKEYYFKHEINSISCNKYGWGTSYKSINNKDLIETGISASKRHTKNIKNNCYYKKNIEAINSFIQLAKTINAKIIFITSPAYKTYVENLDSNQLNSTIEFMNKLPKNNSNVFYYNLLNDKSFKSKDFYDADHLNEIGAKKLSLKLDSIISHTNKLQIE